MKDKFVVTYKEIDNPSVEISKKTYDKDFKKICTLESTENTLYFLKHLKEFDKMNHNFYINVFKGGISPVWEDPSNKNGCNWSLVLKKEVSQRYFEKLLVCFSTGFFKSFDPTGIVGTNKDNRFKLSIWSRNVPVSSEYAGVIAEIKAALEIQYNISFQFKSHSRLLDQNVEDV
ncbi:Eukaryotic translation initiation factor 4E-4 [Nosema bombycis CQ1]|jgi:translation initiation factor 4E|uniref:Eukaryotic translation initiation factor 4E-4 n=1 Tax=Nosema bombycis (strain CQ1 / CVCC 102059) TaxID=578461 RepID=R0MBS8_NOSB1|nr:Eukaryotic translation initiation factor 4E-4 [Nosema bombycis CQ1]|eukprot:EOB15384.1 Eukaryotic translation initiation factor 4E-4 [Nosema bombycis CQ1]